MPPGGWMEDPDPAGELPSDVRLSRWLASIDVASVLRDYERRLTGADRAHLSYLRKQNRRLRQS